MTPGVCRYSIASAPPPGAVSIIELRGDIDAALRALGSHDVPISAILIRDLGGVDRALVARWSADAAWLMPHAGLALHRALVDALHRAGITPELGTPPIARFPEARDEVEAHVLAALSHASSDLAIEVLLRQPARHRAGTAPVAAPVDASLRRLLRPPLIVAIGGANIGKSTLLNTLAGRTVAIVADERGTTRDHVGVGLDLAGLVVRYVDTPGLRDAPEPEEREAIAASLALASKADLILRLGDRNSPPPELRPLALGHLDSATVMLRTDLGRGDWPCDAAVSASTGGGIAELVALLRGRLVPDSALSDPGSWAFWRPA